mgnify:FL=1
MAPIHSEYTPLTLENLKRLPIAPPNLQTYLSTPYNFEKVPVGMKTSRMDMANVLEAWDRRWEEAARA